MGSYVVADEGAGGSGPRGAIGEVRVTDALLLLPRGLSLEGGSIATLAHQCPSGLAAIHSFGEALRRGAQAELDVEPSEISVGLQGRRIEDLVSANLYVADTLENGAGYASELGRPERLLPVMEHIADALSDVWQEEAHAECDAACPDCLRSYDNRHLHPLLDWRLALDVADLVLGRELRTERWLGLASSVAGSFATTFQDAPGSVEVMSSNGLTMVRSEQQAVILTHPLWRIDQVGLNTQQEMARNELTQRGLNVALKDVRLARAYPEGLYQLLA